MTNDVFVPTIVSGSSLSILHYPIPKKRSKNACSRLMILFFLSTRPFPSPPKREIGGMRLSMSVPVVLISPSCMAFSMKAFVRSGLRFSSVMIALSSCSFFFLMYSFHLAATSSLLLIDAMNSSISFFLLLSSGLESMAFRIETRISLSSPLDLWKIVIGSCPSFCCTVSLLDCLSS